MKQHESELLFLDYLEDTLSPQDRAAFETSLSQSQELRDSLAAYKEILAAEKFLSLQKYELSPNFSVKVMNTITETELGLFGRLRMILARNTRLITASVATCATLVLVMRLAWETPIDKISPQSNPAGPILVEPIADAPEHRPAPIGRLEDEAVSSALSQNAPTQKIDNKTLQKQEIGAQGKGQKIGSESLIVVPKEAGQYRERAKKGKDFVMSDKLGASAPAVSSSENFTQIQKPLAELSSSVSQDQLLGFRRQEYVDSESYRGTIENQAALVSQEPVSTFSIDVDTASYTNVRRFIQSGTLPPQDAVRVEEFINYFDYKYPTQTEKPFTLSYEIAPSPLETSKFLLKLGIKARDAALNEQPWNLVFLVDVSGSMADEKKLGLVKNALPILVDRMRSQDRIAIVSYAGNAGLILDSTTGADKPKILRAIDSLGAGGSTNGAGGINLAYEIAARNMLRGGINRVILATDGDFNVGVTSHEDLIRLIETKRQTGITLTTIGVGTGNLKDGMMEQLADKGNGNYFYLDGIREARKVLGTQLASNMEVVAKDVKLQIEFNPQQVASYRLVGYENRKLQRQDFNNDRIDAGEIGPGHTVTALYELVLTGSEGARGLVDDLRYQARESNTSVKRSDNGELAFLKIRFKKPTEEVSSLLQYPIAASDVRKNAEEASDDFRFAAAVGYFGQLLRGSQFAGSYGFQQIAALAEKSLGQDERGYRREFVEIVRDAGALQRAPIVLDETR